jgi:preprotein translocase subunit SecE
MAEGNSLIEKLPQWPRQVKDYLQTLQLEMKSVTWPSRKQVQATTTVVLVTVFAFAAYFAVVDGIIARGITKVFQVFAKQGG